ncbi:MAG TPA: ferritin [Holophaga sp.]|nr:ferritin [Holophaga sp.]
MISATTLAALNAQINAEQYTAQLYLAMSAHLSERSYAGFARWMRIQSQEETDHALKLVDFLLDRRAKPELRPINPPPSAFDGPTSIFEQVLAHERENTESISRCFELARGEGDHATEIALQWFVTEQVKEELAVSAVVDRLRAVGEQGGAIWHLDHEMGKRGR